MILRVGWSPVGFTALAMGLDLVLITLAAGLSYVLMFPDQLATSLQQGGLALVLPFLELSGYRLLFSFVLIGLSFLLMVFGTYRNAFSTSFSYQSKQSLKSIMLVGVGIAVLKLSGLIGDVDPAYCFTFLGFLFLFIPLFKLIVGDLRLVVKRLGIGRVRTVIAGDSEEVLDLYKRISRQLQENYHVVALVPHGRTISPEELSKELRGSDQPAMLSLSDTRELLATEPHQVLFPEPVTDEDELARVRAFCRQYEIVLRLLPVKQTVAVGETRVHDLLGVPLEMPLRRTNQTVGRLLKRLIDIVGASVGLLLLSPLMIATAIAVKLDSPGPVFYLQERVTKRQRRFHIIKFRSMYVDAEKRLEELKRQNEKSGPIFKMKDDPRVTRVGKWIRRLSIDEFPQFFNVLQGHLSLVGPRPPLPKEVADYTPWQLKRLEVIAGITGLWQVSGRSHIDFEEMVLLDLYYIENWSLLLDLEILLDTIPTVLFGKGAF